MSNECAVQTSAAAPILVTGAGGWLASHIIWQLLDRGYYVRGTVRSFAKYSVSRVSHPKSDSHLALIQADLLSSEDWDKAVEGCEYVIHVASPFTFNYKDAETELIRPAVDGVINVFKACLREGSKVKRIIHTSSVCSIVYGHSSARYKGLSEESRIARNLEIEKSRTLLGENAPTQTSDLSQYRTTLSTGTHYGDWKLMTGDDFSDEKKIIGYELSKTLAEKKAWELINEHNQDRIEKIEYVAICPGFVFGPLLAPSHCSGESSIHCQRILERQYPFVPNINSAHVDVRDAALCHVLALEAPSENVAFRRFPAVADDGNINFIEQAKFVARHFDQYGFSIATKSAPSLLIKFGSYFLRDVQAAADKLHCNCYVSNEETRQILGLTKWRLTEEALRAHCLSLIKYGRVLRKNVPQELVDAVAYE